MKVVKIILFIILGLAVIFCAIPLFLASSYNVERSVVINAPANVVFKEVVDFGTWDDWAVWHKMEKDTKYEYSGTPFEVGSKMSWEGDTVGAGSMEISSIEPNQSVSYKLEFLKPFKSEAKADIKFEENNGSTKVTWSINGELSYFARYMGLMMNSGIGPDLENNLSEIKKICEAMPKTHVSISEVDFGGIKYYGIHNKSSMNVDEIKQAFTNSFKELSEFLQKNKMEMTGAPFAVNINYSKDSWEYIAAVQVKDNSVKPTGRIEAGKVEAGKVVKGVHTGPYETMMGSYEAMEKYLTDHNFIKNGNSLEIYVTDPGVVPPDSLITEIYYPVK